MSEQKDSDPYGINHSATLKKMKVDVRPFNPAHMSKRCPSGKGGFGAAYFVKPWEVRCALSGWVTYTLDEIKCELGQPSGGFFPADKYEVIQVLNPVFPPLVVRPHEDMNLSQEEVQIHTREEFLNWIKSTFDQELWVVKLSSLFPGASS